MSVDPNTGIISYTPSEASPVENEAVLRIYDRRGGYAERTFSIEVAGGNHAPSVDALQASYTLVEGLPFELTLTAADADFDYLIYFADNLPPGAIFDPARRSFIWQPGYNSAGIYRDCLLYTSRCV